MLRWLIGGSREPQGLAEVNPWVEPACPAEASVGAGILSLGTMTLLKEGLACCEARFRVEEVGLGEGLPFLLLLCTFDSPKTLS